MISSVPVMISITIAMPTEIAIIIGGIVLAFAVFAVALAWADFYTRNVRVPGALYFPRA
jgi:hypothetical protein